MPISTYFVTTMMAVLAAGCASNHAAQTSRADGGSSPEAARSSAVEAEGRTARLYVKGMSCPLCANNIDKQLLKVPGVRNVLVDLGTGEVRVGLDNAAPPGKDALARAVERSGYTLDRVEMPAGTGDER